MINGNTIAPLIALLALVNGSKALTADCAAVSEIADGIHVRQGHHGRPFADPNFANVGFVVGRKCVAVIDSGGSLQEGAALKCALAKVTDLAVCYLIISHHHFDHALGSLALKTPTVELVGHARLGQSLAASADFYVARLAQDAGIEMTAQQMLAPDRTVTIGEPLVLDLGGRVLRVTAHPPAHSNSDLSVLDSATGTLWLSDLLFVEHIPTLDGSINGWLSELSKLEQQPAKHAVPGHGPVRVDWPAGAGDTRRYLQLIRRQSRELIQQGASLARALREIGRGERERWVNFDLHHQRNVTRAFTELEWE